MRFFVFALLSVFQPSFGHVALTFPPARKFALDFLDNGRTLPPCGMPKGNVRTSLLAGSSFNVTWHLAYPHKGGFRLEVLDEQEKHVLYLTLGKNFQANDVTAQQYQVQLPQDFRCRDCTLRLVREASEWGDKYQFFSCADIDILPRQEYREDCSGHGRSLPGRQLMCRCDRLYSGPRCQNKEECIDDRDCGSHGKCIDIESTSAPRRQCFCEAGWFGPGCSSKSPVKNSVIDPDAYRKKELHPDLTLYWRVIRNGEEIEFALVAKGTSYVALGWRPVGLDESCRKFPEIVGPTGFYEEPTEKPVVYETTNVNNDVIEDRVNATVLGEDGNSTEVEANLLDEDISGFKILTNLTDGIEEPVPEPPATHADSGVVLVMFDKNGANLNVSADGVDVDIESTVGLNVVSVEYKNATAELAQVVTSATNEAPDDEYEIEYYDDGNATQSTENATRSDDENAGDLVVNDIPGGLLALVPTVPRTQKPEIQITPQSAQNIPKMETDGWRPILKPTPAPEDERVPVSEVLPVDSRTSTAEPGSTRRLTGLEKLKQKLSSRVAEATESSVGKGVFRQVNLNDYEFVQLPDMGEWHSSQKHGRKRRSPEEQNTRQQRGFAIPLDDDEEEPEPEVEPTGQNNQEDGLYETHDHDHSAHNHDHSTRNHDHSTHEHDHSTHEHDHSTHEHDHSTHDHDHSTLGVSDETEPVAEPEPGVVGKIQQSSQSLAEPEPEPEPKADAGPTQEPELESTPNVDWSPRGALNGMDCTDIVIGMARGSLSRINDYYTRDRSTPRVDTFFGGRNDLTAAFAEEVDGVTTFIFRRKTNATEQTDHSITPGPMHVIWAKGQERGSYHHSPKSGLESGNSSVPDFYKPDELKYHGRENRGVVQIDFFATEQSAVNLAPSETGNTTVAPSPHHHHHEGGSRNSGHKHKTDAFCGGEYRNPSRCDPTGSDCLYYAKWEFLEKTDEVKFTIRTNYTYKWIGIGFGQSTRMSETDAVIGWLDTNGRSAVLDMWVLGYSHPRIDEQQDIRDTKIQILEGKTIMSFIRKRVTRDKTQDVQFGDDSCVYFKYPVEGGTFNAVQKKIIKHSKVPVVSDNRICIRSCPGIGTGDTGINFVKEPENPQMIYDWSVKVKETAKGFVIPEPETEEFISFARHVSDNLTPTLEKIPGFQDVVVKSVSKDGEDVVAHLSLVFEEKKNTDGATVFDDSAVRQVITDTVSVGQIGRLRVDPQFVKLQALGATSSIAKDEPGGYKKVGPTTLYIVIGCLAALFFIFLVQAIVTICTTRKSRSLPSREQMITQSAWKDYSTTNSQHTNFAYESFGEDIKIASHSSRGSRDSLYQNGQVQERIPITRNNRHKEPTPVANSLPRPRYEVQQTLNYVNHTTSRRNSAVQEPSSHPSQFYPSHRPNGTTPKSGGSQPDFYFMPSQRRYSGEVVRVYVDYNTKPK